MALSFIKKYCSAMKLPKPQWLNENKPHYPNLSNIRKHVGMAAVSDSDDGNKSVTDKYESTSDNSSPPQRHVNTIRLF